MAAVAALALLITAAAARAQPTSVPIHARVLSNGAVIYGVTVVVDGRPVEAALDTGSSGLRLLPGAAPPPAPDGRSATYEYSGGVQLRGVRTPAEVAIGGRMGRVAVQAVSEVGCAPARPHCGAASLTIERFGFEGAGLPGEGFRAILGLGMAGKTPNLLTALGARRWIVSLPRPGETEGRLVIDPSDDEAAGFDRLPLARRLAWREDAAHDAVDACLESQGPAPPVCGATLLDTGAAAVAVVNSGAQASWAHGATLTFRPETGQALSLPLTRAPIVVGENAALPHPFIEAGRAPYMAFDVLYDPARRAIGLRPRGAGPLSKSPAPR